MGKRLVFLGPCSVGFEEYPEPQMGPQQICVETLYSGISHGTEMNVFRGTAPFFSKKWDPKYDIFLKEESSWKYPVSYGYEEVCKVTEVGENVSKVKVGDIICAAYGHQTTAVLNADRLNASSFSLDGSLIPKGIDPVLGIFHLLANVAFNGVRKASTTLGDKVAVFGLGVIGLLTIQFSKLSGADPVIAVDLIDKRLELAEKLGADIILNPRIDDVALEIKKTTDGGTDVVFESSGSIRALHEAVRSCRYGSKAIALGWYQGGAGDLFLGEEFHHNNISIICARGGLPSAVGRRWDWTRINNTVFHLVSKGKLELKELVTHKFPFNDAAAAYELIDKHPEHVIKCVLEF
jgi:2-desacetyl-2-hydroxyethyl bacteriochlorophyllide A dehydrogenase